MPFKGKHVMFACAGVALNVFLIDKFLVNAQPLKHGHAGDKIQHNHGHRYKVRALEDVEYDRLKAFFNRRW